MKGMLGLGRRSLSYGLRMNPLMGSPFVGSTLHGQISGGRRDGIHLSHWHFSGPEPDDSVTTGLLGAGKSAEWEGEIKNVYDCYDKYAGIEVRMSPIMFDHYVRLLGAAYGVPQEFAKQKSKITKEFIEVLHQEATHFEIKYAPRARKRWKDRGQKVGKFVVGETIGFLIPVPVVGSVAATVALKFLSKVSQTKKEKRIKAQTKSAIEEMHKDIQYASFNPFILRDYYGRGGKGDAPRLLWKDYEASFQIDGPSLYISVSEETRGKLRQVRPSIKGKKKVRKGGKRGKKVKGKRSSRRVGFTEDAKRRGKERGKRGSPHKRSQTGVPRGWTDFNEDDPRAFDDFDKYFPKKGSKGPGKKGPRGSKGSGGKDRRPKSGPG